MATSTRDSAEESLTYRSRDLVTFKASCDRVLPNQEAPAGRLQTLGHADVKQKLGTKDILEVSFELTVTGTAKDASEKVAFSASCTVGYEVKFSRAQGEDLPMPLLRQLATPLFHVASERCRNLIWSMGYPVSPSTKLPELVVAKPLSSGSDPVASDRGSHKKVAIRRTRAPRKSET